MTFVLVSHNPKVRQRFSKAPLKVFVNDTTPVTITVGATLYPPESSRATSPKDLLALASEAFDELPYSLRTHAVLKGGMAMVPRYSDSSDATASCRIEATLGGMTIRVKDIEQVLINWKSVELVMLRFSNCWIPHGWRVKTRLMVLCNTVTPPPTWLEEGCNKYKLPLRRNKPPSQMLAGE